MGETLVITGDGVTVNGLELVTGWPYTLTCIGPVVAPLGTVTINSLE